MLLETSAADPVPTDSRTMSISPVVSSSLCRVKKKNEKRIKKGDKEVIVEVHRRGEERKEK